MRRFMTFLLLLMVSLPIYAKGEPEADTFLWKISKENRPTSYLLGTIHIGKLNSTLPPIYKRTLNKVSQLVIESHAQALSLSQQKQIMFLMSDTRPLSQSLGKKRVADLQKILQNGEEKITLNEETSFKPWAVWLNTQSQFTPKGYSAEYGIDNLLTRAATTQKKNIIALETIEPLYYFDALPEKTILRALDSFIIHHQAFLDDEKTLLIDYQQQHAKKIWADIINPDKELRYFPIQDRKLWQQFMYQNLLIERNQTWLPRLIEILPKQSSLIAVGSAHLFGEQGLIMRLRQVGYTIEPVLVKKQH